MYERLINLFKSSAAYTVGNLLNRAMFIVSMPVMTRYLSPNDYGILSLVNTVTGLLMTFYGLGVHDYGMRYYYEQNTNEGRKRLMGGLATFLILFALAASAGLSFLGKFVSPILLKDVPFSPYMIIGIWSCFFASFETIPDALFRVRDEPFLFVAVKLVRSALTIALAIASVILLHRGAEGPLSASLLVSAASVLYFLLYMKGKASPNLSMRLVKRALVFSLPILPLLTGSFLLEAADRLMLQYYLGLSVVAFYSVGSTLGMVLLMIAHSINTAWAPFYYDTARNADPREASRIFSFASTYFAAVILFCALIPVVLRHEIILLLAPADYSPVIEIVPVIMAGAVLNSLYLFPLRAVFQQEKTSILPWMMFLALGVNVGLNVALIPPLGMLGAALGTAGSGGAMLVCCLVVSQRLFPIPYQYARLGKLLVAFAVCYGLSSLALAAPLAVSLLLRSFIISLFPVILFLFGFFEKAERQKLHEIAVALCRKVVQGTKI